MRKITTITLALCITAAGASAASYWTAGSGGLWTDTGSWTGGTPADNGASAFVKASDMGAAIGADYLAPTIEVGIDAVARNLSLEVGTANSITMSITGGTLTMTRGGGTSNYLRLGAGGSTGTAILNMTGGRIWVDSSDGTYNPGGNDYVRVGSGYNAEINMSGDAQIWARDLLITSGSGNIDLSDTALIYLKADDTTEIAAFVADGRITAYGGTGIVNYSYDVGSDLTTITASIPEPATLGLVVLVGGGLLWIRNRFGI